MKCTASLYIRGYRGLDVPILVSLVEHSFSVISTYQYYGKSKPEQDFPKLLNLYARGLLQLDEMITRTYPLERLQDALDDMLAGRNAKGVIVFDPE